MFHRLARHFMRMLPISTILSGYLCYNQSYKMSEISPQQKLQLDSSPLIKNNKITIVKDIQSFLQGQLVPNRFIIFFELSSNSFINHQIIQIAQKFIKTCSNKISQDFEFVLLQNNGEHTNQEQNNYFMIYTSNGQKAISLDSYLLKNIKQKDIKVDYKPLFKRIIEYLNKYKQLSLENINQEFQSIQLSDNYQAIFTSSLHNQKTDKPKAVLEKFMKKYEIRHKNLNKFIIKDARTKAIFNANESSAQEAHLLVPNNKNLKTKNRQKLIFFSINGKQFTNINISKSNLNEIFVFPPIQEQLQADKYVLNVYINKNRDYSKIQDKVYEQLQKDQYQKYTKNIYYTAQVQNAAIIYQMNDYTRLILKAFQSKTHLHGINAKELLSNTYQYRYNINNQKEIDGLKIQAWIDRCEKKIQPQFYKSEKSEPPVWAEQITGQEYKQIRDSKGDKIIYHYSHHCYGCKKFGGKFEEFAKKKGNYQNLSFYRINNDSNKAEGVRNYNSTPVFVYYKNGYKYPFIYKQPIFTQKLFDDFLRITSQVKIIPHQQFQKNISSNTQAKPLFLDLLKDLQ